VLDLAQWGVTDPATLSFLDPPPAPALKEARSLLQELDALDADGRITAEGKRLRALTLPPRLARMIVDSDRLGAGAAAAEIAAILTERGLGGDSVDLDHRLEQFRRDRSPRASSARDLARRWASQVASSLVPAQSADPSTGIMLAFAFPDRVAKNRGNGSFVLANGRGAAVEQTSALARAPYIAVGELTGTAAAGRILLAAPISQEEIEAQFAGHIQTADEITFDRGAMALRARRRKTLHAITLSEAPLALQPSADTARVFAEGLVAAGLDRLPWSKSARQWRDRVMFLRKAEGESWPDLSDDGLIARAADWLVPALYDKTSLRDLSAGELPEALLILLPWELRARLDREAPTHFEAPTGTMLAIDYEAEQGPTIAVRLQELFGLNTHPSVAKGKVPLVLELLSPAQRPVQVTRDLPGFWRGSYAAVRSDLRGRYPRHPWPEDPANALPTRRVKPRGT
jgi:ATP-dependent helicase HrpB